MADKNQIVLELQAKTTKLEAALKRIQKETKKTDKEVDRMRISTAGLRRSIGALRNNMLLVSFAFGGTLASVNKLVKAYGEQQLAEKKLEQALGFTSKALLTQASALQQTTAFGDEAIIGVQALIGAFTKDEEQIKALTKTTLDLAAAKGMDLTAAADLVSKSFGSSTNALSRYGIQVEGAVGSTERLENLTGNVAALFGGQASAQADTMTGSIQQMQNALGDTAETMGALLEPSTIAFSKSIKKAAEGWSDFFLELKETEMETAIRQLREMGAAAEDIALLQQFVDIEKHTDSLINNNEKIVSLLGLQGGALGDQSKLRDRELQFLGASVKHYQQNLGNKMHTAEQYSRIVTLADTEKVTQERIETLISRIVKKNKEIIKDKDKLSSTDRQEISDNSQKIKDLTELLKLVKDRELAERLLANIGKENQTTTSPTAPDPTAFELFAEQQREKLKNFELEQEHILELQNLYPQLAESLGLLTEEQKLANQEAEKAARIAEKESDKAEATKKRLADAEKKRQEDMRKEAFKTSADIGRLALKDVDAARNAALDKIFAYAMTASAKQMEKILVEYPFPLNVGLAAVGGIAAGALVGGAADKLKAAQYGMNEVVDQPTMILAGEAGAEQVSITPLEGPNIDGVQGEGASVVVNVSGNVLTSDFVEGELADNIREAVRRGTDFGMG